VKGPYSRVYWSIVDDPMFERVFDNDRALATWLRMLLMADAMYPASAPMTSRNPTVRMLIDCGLVIEKPGNRYTIRGLQAERERRSASARNAAAVRWHSKGNADAMPRRDETSKDEQIGANAPSGTFMGFRPKATPSLDDVKRQEQEAWAKCAVCKVIGRKHPTSGDHEFKPLRSAS
jgi:hypothetical protein